MSQLRCARPRGSGAARRPARSVVVLPAELIAPQARRAPTLFLGQVMIEVLPDYRLRSRPVGCPGAVSLGKTRVLRTKVTQFADHAVAVEVAWS